MFSVTPECALAASTARKAEPSAGPSIDAFMAAACAWPSGEAASASSSFCCASAQSVIMARIGPDAASMPVIWPKRVMKVRRVVSPRIKASTSASRPA
jgi:hypothetical protein